MTRAAMDAGMQAIGFTGHGTFPPDLRYCMKPENVPIYAAEVNRCKEKYAGKIAVWLGVENEFYGVPPAFDWDFALGVTHYLYKDGNLYYVDHSPQLQQQAIREAFGSAVFHADGTLDRPALSKTVFGNTEALAALNAITHPLIQSEMEAQIEACRKQGAEIVVLDVPLLFEANMQHMGDLTACAYCPEETQIARMKTRNGFDREQALARIRSQMPVRQKAERSDVVISTDLPLEELQKDVRRLYQGWLSAARKENE